MTRESVRSHVAAAQMLTDRERELARSVGGEHGEDLHAALRNLKDAVDQLGARVAELEARVRSAEPPLPPGGGGGR